VKLGTALVLAHVVAAVSVVFFMYSLRTHYLLTTAAPNVQAVRPLCDLAPSVCSEAASSPVAQDARQFHRFWSSQVTSHLEFARIQLIAWSAMLAASLCSALVLHRVQHKASQRAHVA